MSASLARPAHRVVALVNAPQSTFELSCAAEVFGITRPGLANPYTFRVCTPTPGPIATLAGYDMVVSDGLDTMRDADTVVVAGWQRLDMPMPTDMLKALVRAHERGARIVAICSGAFVLAEAGLLDGRRAATHWRLAAEMAQRFPHVHVEPDVLYVDDGDIATSAGSAAGIDLCLHLIGTDQGAAYATNVARHMVMPPHREGGQLQFAPVKPPRSTTSLAPVLEWATSRLHQQIGVDDLASIARMAPRTLARRFDQQLGVSPGQWLLAQRVAAARALLEETDLPVETIAVRVGLSSAVNLRRRFDHALGTTPAAYRRAFRLHIGPM
jgi:AraC family transcriptional regulator, transcriptional activator FtrA